jgi:hypothetical protein
LPAATRLRLPPLVRSRMASSSISLKVLVISQTARPSGLLASTSWRTKRYSAPCFWASPIRMAWWMIPVARRLVSQE